MSLLSAEVCNLWNWPYIFFCRVKFWQTEGLCAQPNSHIRRKRRASLWRKHFRQTRLCGVLFYEKCSLRLSRSVSLFTGKMSKKDLCSIAAGNSGGSGLAFSVAWFPRRRTISGDPLQDFSNIHRTTNHAMVFIFPTFSEIFSSILCKRIHRKLSFSYRVEKHRENTAKRTTLPRGLVRQECERQKCERHHCEANSANANSAKGSTVRMRQECECQQCECQQCDATSVRKKCDSSANANSANRIFFNQLFSFSSIFFLFYWLKNSTTEFFVFQKKNSLIINITWECKHCGARALDGTIRFRRLKRSREMSPISGYLPSNARWRSEGKGRSREDEGDVAQGSNLSVSTLRIRFFALVVFSVLSCTFSERCRKKSVDQRPPKSKA